ncbi:MAG: hypothetical protein ABJ263_10930 [Tateyamaria sp.]|uniref:hypothetical protein n=2 Tax=Tateyamaria sp. TaxID=1929288 RepID=UPI00328AC44C
MRNFCVMLSIVGLTGCLAPPVPEEPEFEPEPVPLYEPENPGPWCGYATRIGLNPDTPASEKEAIEALAAERGC